MLENATVTLSVKDFDELRKSDAAYKNIAPRLGKCFEYMCIANDVPKECNGCRKKECKECETDKEYPLYTEKLTVDVEQLVKVAKECSLYGKDVKRDIDAMLIKYKEEQEEER